MALDLALAKARSELEAAVEEKEVTAELHEMMCTSHPKAMVTMLGTATKRIAELQVEVACRDNQIRAHIVREDELKNAKTAETKKWMGVVQRKNAEMHDVSPTHSHSSYMASIHLYVQLHEAHSELT